MKKIINDKLYDTDTATLICQTGIYGSWGGDCYIPVRSSLYKTNNGNFFLVRTYPAASSFIMKCLSGSWKDDSFMQPITKKQAKSEMILMGKLPAQAA